jgi:ABC-type multidrug transport system, ATPase and permease components
MTNYFRLLVFLKEVKAQLIIRVLLGLLLTVTWLVQAISTAQAISAVLGRSQGQVQWYIVLIAVCIFVRGVLLYFIEGYAKKMGATLKHTLRQKMLDKLMRLGVAYQNDKRSGNMQSLVTDGVEAFESFLAGYVPQMFIVLLTLIPIVYYLCSVHMVVGIVVLLAVVLSVLLPHITMPFVSKTTVEYWQTYAVLNAQYIDAMQGMNVLKAFNAVRQKRAELAKDSKDFFEDSMRNTTFSLIDSAAIILFMVIGSSVAICVAAWYTYHGEIAPAKLVLMLFLIVECTRPVIELNNLWHGSYLGFSVADEFFEILDTPENNKTQTTKQHALEESPSVEVKALSFRYKKQNAYALQNLTFSVRNAETIAIVGKSGSGKSTIVNLLLNFFQAESGEIFINGRRIQEYTEESLRSRISVVFQDTYLFYGTIRENIVMSQPGASMEEVERAAKLASIHEYIHTLPLGYETVVGERGATLSGGERQRIAIARAILKDAPILILDEATSSVDTDNEAVIQEALDKLSKGRTTIVIAHRLSTVQKANKILVLGEGVLLEEGSHEELLKRKGAYYNLVQAQQRAGVAYE